MILMSLLPRGSDTVLKSMRCSQKKKKGGGGSTKLDRIMKVGEVEPDQQEGRGIGRVVNYVNPARRQPRSGEISQSP